ncbi:MAG: gliding motility-associated C-terminal domain-containing protein [Bacteroidales bacterium]|nr:gliding motility-associated C-terminal domain-containing protein [Bacteroidales bacterium]
MTRRTKILIYLLAAALPLLVSYEAEAQVLQQAACPGWYNPTTFVTGNSSYYYTGNFGQRGVTVPDAMSGTTGITIGSSGLAATALDGASTTALNYSGNLPQPTRRFAIMTDTLGYDANTGGNLPYVPTHLSHNNDFIPSHYTSSIRIGNAALNESFAANTLRYTFTVTPDNAMFSLLYALVMQAPQHSDDINPLFEVRLMRNTGPNTNWQYWSQINDTLAYFLVVNQNNIVPQATTAGHGWHRIQDGTGEVYYRDWDRITIDLTPYLDSTVCIEVSTSGCAYNFHWGYAYIAGDCRPAEPQARSCDVTGDTAALLTAAYGAMGYRWYASEMGEATSPGAGHPFRALTDTLSGDGANRYAAQPGDFHITRRLSPSGDTVEADSTGKCQTFRCDITTALDPQKPYTTRHYTHACNERMEVAYHYRTDCDGSVAVWSDSRAVSGNDSYAPSLTTWEFYADGDFSAPPLLTLSGDSVVAMLAGRQVVGVLMRTSDTHISCTGEERFLVHIPQPPAVMVSGSTHLYPGTPTDLTAQSDSNCTYQWSLTPWTVSGGLPAGAFLRTVPQADTTVYYIQATSTATGCTVWDSITVFTYDTSRHSIMNHLFTRISIDTAACLGNSQSVRVGHEVHNEIVVADRIATLSHPGRTFLPDGKPCGTAGCSYRSPVTFSTFASDATVTSANDINHVRLNLEHSYIGDIYIGITCPNGQSATLMRKHTNGQNAECASAIPPSAIGWQAGSNTPTNTFFGQAYDSEAASDYCDSTLPGNAPGIGWNYCWSNSTTAGNSYAPGDALIYRDVSTHSYRVDSSDVAARTNFYHPDQHFNALVGCPLNGTWYIEVIDGYSGDNGYIFDWELSLTAPAVDSTIVITGSEIIGHDVARANDSTYVITSPAGVTTDTTVAYTILLFDSLGIVADTTVFVHYYAPSYTLIEESRCHGDTIWVGPTPYLDDIHSTDTLYSAIGCPIYTEINLHFNPVYEVFDTARFCPYEPLLHNDITYAATGDYTLRLNTTRDCDSTVHLRLEVLDSGFRAAFEISDDGDTWSRDTMLAGCQPYRVLLHDLSTLSSSNRWLFGNGLQTDGDSIDYTFDSVGVYPVTLIATSEHGCHDTAWLDSVVWVFGQTTPEFIWTPEHPVTSHPTATFHNHTQGTDINYLWSIPTSTGGNDTTSAFDLTYTWGGGTEVVFGDYDVTLYTLQAHLTPYGDTLRCLDSVTHTVTIINDWLQFPNLVTPNGDGVNDRWEVVNLLECGLYSMNELWIYNAWGTLVYHKRDIKTETDFWDPAASNCPDGTYYYRFAAKSPYGLVRHQGAIEVLRN